MRSQKKASAGSLFAQAVLALAIASALALAAFNAAESTKAQAPSIPPKTYPSWE